MELATDIILHSSCLCWCISLKSVNCFCCSVTKSCLTLCDPMAACQAPLSSTIAWSWLRFKSVESVMLSNHLIPGRPLLLLPSVFPSIRIFPSESAFRIRWPKYWSFSFSISPSKESVQFSSVARLCPTLCDPVNRSTLASLSITNSWSSLRLRCIESVMPSSHLKWIVMVNIKNVNIYVYIISDFLCLLVFSLVKFIHLYYWLYCTCYSQYFIFIFISYFISLFHIHSFKLFHTGYLCLFTFYWLM